MKKLILMVAVLSTFAAPANAMKKDIGSFSWLPGIVVPSIPGIGICALIPEDNGPGLPLIGPGQMADTFLGNPPYPNPPRVLKRTFDRFPH